MMIRKKTIEYNNDTENYSIEQRTTVNLTTKRARYMNNMITNDRLPFPYGNETLNSNKLISFAVNFSLLFLTVLTQSNQFLNIFSHRHLLLLRWECRQ